MKKRTVMILASAMILCASAASYAGYQIYKNQSFENDVDEEIEKLYSLKSSISSADSTEIAAETDAAYIPESESEISSEESQTDKPQIPTDSDGYYSDYTVYSTETIHLSELREKYPSLVGWIFVGGTAIDFPVMQAEDNSYYLSHSYDGTDSYCGCPFLDYRNNSDFSDFNSIIYGHNMSGGRMFSALQNFRNKAFFDSHTTGTLLTPEGEHTVEFFACCIADKNDYPFTTVFLTDEQRGQFIDDILKNAMFTRDVNTEGRRILVLSTCAELNSDNRTVLIGVY